MPNLDYCTKCGTCGTFVLDGLCGYCDTRICPECGEETAREEMSVAVEGRHQGYLVCDCCLED